MIGLRRTFPTGRKGLFIAAALSACVLVACESTAPEPPPPPPPPPPPVLALNSSVSEAASIYLAFMRDMSAMEGGFQSGDAIHVALNRGANYEPNQLSRGMIAYGVIVALQSSEFVEGVRRMGTDPEARQTMIHQILADPVYAAQLPGARQAAGMVAASWLQEAQAIAALGQSIENDAYTIQERNDPRRRWAVQAVNDRPARIAHVQALSAAPMLPTAEESARLFAAAHTGNGLDLSRAQQDPPYTPAVIRSLSIAALAVLGAAGDESIETTNILSDESTHQFCLRMSKLNLFQCLTASRPHYEDMFCVGRHIMSDLAQCTVQSAGAVTMSLPTPVTLIASAPSVEGATRDAAETAAEPGN
ncbi:MAG: hypothetical protein ACK4E3_11390 [Brevundimonas sp.]|uniref:hypothetical protein n=1 Tax=Brevundimonas sp. TaxID=1871086 RepID=UPI0039191408